MVLHSEKKYYEAIKLYNEFLLEDSIEERRHFLLWKIANCYDSLGEKGNAKNYYREAIMAGKVDYSYRKRQYAVSLGEIFLSEKLYDSALYYLKYTNALISVKNLCGSNSLFFRTPFQYKLMKVYDGIGLVDSAITCFLPYAFQEWTNSEGTEYSTQHLYTSDYHCQVIDFLNILTKKYGKEYVFSQLQKLPENATFNEIGNGPSDYGVELWLNFMGTKILFDGFGSMTVSDDNSKEGYINSYKRSLMNDLKHSLIYLFATEERLH